MDGRSTARFGDRPDARSEAEEQDSSGNARVVYATTILDEHSCADAKTLIEAMIDRENMTRALLRVESNKGAAGIDKMPVDDLRSHLGRHWERIRAALLAGRYEPSPVRLVEIPKPDGQGMRQLGIPTVVDRLIAQALAQILTPLFEPNFSEHSYGFRPGRSAHDAVTAAQAYVREGRGWVVDMDIEKFFDHVNHDILMSRLMRKITDKRVLKLIRRFLQAGIMTEGIAMQRTEGTPQGSPLSPLLSNILLDDLDKELEKRGHAFCRYADDCNIYVRSRKAGERVLASIRLWLGDRLRLRLNEEKSAVDRPWKRTFLGYGMTGERETRLTVSTKNVKRFKSRLRMLYHKGRGRNLGRFIVEDLLPVLRGWFEYFRLAEVKRVFKELDGWIRRHLRKILWRQWKRPRTRQARLRSFGISGERAWKSSWNGRGPWWNAGASHMNQALPKSFFQRLGLYSLLDEHLRRQTLSRTAVYGTVRTVV
ncbi:MAG: group II intron reverse transcriptase/maturase [Bacteroidetes bacterium]|nr:group II intron reverse transcriptase/maturase [Bacteroidota bacterium]